MFEVWCSISVYGRSEAIPRHPPKIYRTACREESSERGEVLLLRLPVLELKGKRGRTPLPLGRSPCAVLRHADLT